MTASNGGTYEVSLQLPHIADAIFQSFPQPRFERASFQNKPNVLTKHPTNQDQVWLVPKLELTSSTQVAGQKNRFRMWLVCLQGAHSDTREQYAPQSQPGTASKC